MSWFDWFRTRRRMDRDLAEEIEQHLEEKVASLMAQGMSRAKASRAARVAFGNPVLLQEKSREVWQWTMLENLGADTKFALRRLFHAPLFSATAILTLALGIGANTGVFTLMHALLRENLPIPEPNRLVRIALDTHSPLGAVDDLPLSLPLLESIEQHAQSLSGVFGWSAYDFVLMEDTGLHVYSGAVVSGNTFPLLGIAPAAGRLLTVQDDRKGGGPDGWAAVISHRFWQGHYHADPSVIGKRVMLTDHSVTIVGVAPQGFEGVIAATHPDFYLPLEYEPVMRGAGSVLHLPGNVWLTTWARLKPGVSLRSASAEMHTLFRVAVDETLPPVVRHVPVIEQSTFTLRPGDKGWSSLRPQYAKPLLLLQALVGIVLLVCCVNLAGLSLARAAAHEHEFAIRGALGAPRSRLMQQPLVESLLLALAGGTLAVGLAWAIDRYLLRFLADPHAAASLSVRPQVATLLATGGCAVLCALLFGMGPAWLASRASLEPALRPKGESPRLGMRLGMRLGEGSLMRSMFVPVQIALTLVLVVVAAALIATVGNLRTTHQGFRTENVYFAPADFERLPQKGADLVHLYRRIVARIGQMPGVESVSVGESTPLGNNGQIGFFANSAASAENPANPANQYWKNDVGANYFRALGTGQVAGRSFTDSDADADTCILNRSAAIALFHTSTALGQTVWQSIRSINSGQSTSRECRVIGIVEDVKHTSLREAAPPTVYYPFGVDTGRLFSMNFVIHAATQAEAQNAYRKTLHELAPNSPEGDLTPFAMQFNDSIARERLLSILSGFFAALTLLLSAIGVYGLVASDVTRRTTEIGVRMALGATRGNIFGLILRKAAALLSMGVLAGVGLAYLAAHSLKAFLYGVEAGTPAIFIAAISLLALTGFLAALLPARRAVSTEPVQALRQE